MDRRWVLWFGIIVVVIGVFLLAGEVFHFNGGAFLCPLFLVALGAWLIVRPRMHGSQGEVYTRILGDVVRSGNWQVTAEEIWLGIGDLHLDLTNAEIPEGETTLTVFGFVNDIKLTVPEGVGIGLHTSAFISDSKMYGEKETAIFMPLDRNSDDFNSCTRKVILRTNHFVLSVKVRRPR
jgi:predicted membrane protein